MSSWSVDAAAVPYLENQDHKPVVMDLIEHTPISRADPPCPGIAYEPRGLPWPRVVSEPVDDTPDSPAHGRIQPCERLPGIVAEDDLISHGS